MNEQMYGDKQLHEGPLWRINLSRPGEQLASYERQASYDISKETTLLVDLVTVDSKYQGQTLVVEQGKAPVIVKRSLSHLIKKLNTRLLNDYDETRLALNKNLGCHYRMPLMSGKGIFVPLDSFKGKPLEWFNLLHIEAVLKKNSQNVLRNETTLSFKGGLEVIIPRSVTSFLKNLQKDFLYSHYYFSFINWVLGNEGYTLVTVCDELQEQSRCLLDYAQTPIGERELLAFSKDLKEAKANLMIQLSLQLSMKEVGDFF